MDETTKIIALETSGKIGSVALGRGSQIIAEQDFTESLQHAAQLLPTMDRLSREHSWQPGDIDQVFVSAGPGSFTGIRIAITTAKIMAFALKTRIVAVPSLEVLALNAIAPLCASLSATSDRSGGVEGCPGDKLCVPTNTGCVAAVLEAGRGKIFAAAYKLAGLKYALAEPALFVADSNCLIEPQSLLPQDLLEKTTRPLFLLGEGLKYHDRELSPKESEIILLDEKLWQPRAVNVFQCGLLRSQAGLFADPILLTPNYLRRPEAEEKWLDRQ